MLLLFFDISENIQRDLEKYKSQGQTSRQINVPEGEMFIQQSFWSTIREHATDRTTQTLWKTIMGKWNQCMGEIK